MERINSIDTLRGLSVLFYFMFHFSSWWTPGSTWWITGGSANAYLFFFIPYLGIVAAPIFIMVSGMSMRISIENRRRKNIPEAEIRTHVIKRGVIILIFSLFLNFLFYSSGEYIWFWNALGTIAVSGIIVYFTSKYSIKLRVIIVIIMILFYPTIRVVLQIEASYTILTYRAPWSLDRFFADMISNGMCPIIPQSVIAVLGSIMAESLFSKTKMKKMTPKLLICCSLITIISIMLESNPNFFPWKDGMFWLGTYGIWFLVFIVLFWLQDVKKILHGYKFLAIISSLSLSLFYIHIIFGYFVVYLSGGVQKLSPYSFYLMLVFFCVILFIFGTFWSKVKFKFSLEWILRKLS